MRYLATLSLVLFAISLVRVNAANYSITAGETITRSVPGYQSDSCTFRGTNGTAITLLISGHESGTQPTPSVTLYAPNGTIMVQTSGVPSVTLQALRLTQTGTYGLTLRNPSFEDANFYGVSLAVNPGPNNDTDGGVIMPGVIRQSHISGGDLDSFTFSGTYGTPVVLAMQDVQAHQLGFVPRVELHRPDGSVMQTVSGLVDGGAFLRGCLDASGTWFIICRDLQGIYTADYRLSLVTSAIHAVKASNPDPYLAVTFCGERIHVRWLTNASGFRLESRMGLADSWTGVTNLINVIDTDNSVFVPNVGHQFFRLFQP